MECQSPEQKYTNVEIYKQLKAKKLKMQQEAYASLAPHTRSKAPLTVPRNFTFNKPVPKPQNPRLPSCNRLFGTAFTVIPEPTTYSVRVQSPAKTINFKPQEEFFLETFGRAKTGKQSSPLKLTDRQLRQQQLLNEQKLEKTLQPKMVDAMQSYNQCNTHARLATTLYKTERHQTSFKKKSKNQENTEQIGPCTYEPQHQKEPIKEIYINHHERSTQPFVVKEIYCDQFYNQPATFKKTGIWQSETYRVEKDDDKYDKFLETIGEI